MKEPANRSLAAPRPANATFAGLFLVALTSLAYEILLTRIFSVTMWYHFSFVAISVAMFGMTAGAMVVYLRTAWFPPAGAHRQLAGWSLALAAGIVLSFIAQLFMSPRYELTAAGVLSVGLFYIVTALPFLLSGVTVCLALTRFPAQVGRLYGADLAGAAGGCVVLILMLELVDGPSAVLLTAALAAVAAFCFARAAGRVTLQAAAAILCALLLAGGSHNAVQARDGRGWLALRTVKGKPEVGRLYERWNSHSRITVSGDRDAVRFPFGWGLSSTYPAQRGIRYLYLQIDAGATTVLPRYQGDRQDLEYLKYDIVNLAHWLRRDADVAVIGSGGGRDLHAAIAFDQRSAVGIEVNHDIIDAVTGPFADWTGNLAVDPRVRLVNAEARSWITRSHRSFDIIQISFIDTWAATAAGAYVLAENTLYTVEAWRTFLEHLNPGGILTVCRWYDPAIPAEAYRSVALAAAALRRIGVADPRGHIVLARNLQRAGRPHEPVGVATLLVGKEAFTEPDLELLSRKCGDMQFDLVLTPPGTDDPRFARLAAGEPTGALSDSLRLNLSPPTDDEPFFFQQLRLGDVLSGRLRDAGVDLADYNFQAVRVLGSLLIAVVIITLLFLIVPLLSRGGRRELHGAGPLLLFFAGIGLGFMMVEISLLQRLTVWLGHPAYGLSVVLFSLLLSAGMGSLATSRLGSDRRVVRWFAALLAVLLVFGLAMPPVGRWLMAQITPVRIGVAVAILLPLGFCMGMAFPSGMRLAARLRPGLMPWLFGVNGATSVCASVLAVAIALAGGISASYWTGAACYAIALVALLAAERRAGDSHAGAGGGSQPEDRAHRAARASSPVGVATLFCLLCLALCLAAALAGCGRAEREAGSAKQRKGEWVKLPVRLVRIVPGTFLMGGEGALLFEPGAVQRPPHEVAITRPFLLSATEITQAQWSEVTGKNPSYHQPCDDCPVERITWFDAVTFCNALSERERLTRAYSVQGEDVTWDRNADGYRLPTEAEWEYACRAGSTTPFNTGNCLGSDQANFNGYHPLTGCPEGMYRGQTVPVASFPPNRWGLYDMHGNVFEWCWDWYALYPEGRQLDPAGPPSGQRRTMRGGAWGSDANRCRSDTRPLPDPHRSLDAIGMRVARSMR